MEKKFQNLRYDLSENIYYHDVKYDYKPLIHLCSFEFCSLVYQKSNIIKHLLKWIEIRGKEYKFEEMLSKFEEETPESNILVSSYIKKGFKIMGKEVFSFLSDLDDMIFAPYFIRNFIFTKEGTINLNKTVSKILEIEKDLEPESKFKLACEYYLGDQLITDCFKMLPRNLQINYEASSGKDSVICEYTPFWIWNIKNFRNFEREKDSSQELEKSKIELLDLKIEKIFYRSINEGNGVQIQYLWENFISKRKDRENIIQKILKDLLNMNDNNLDIFIYFLFQLECHHGEFFNDIFKSDGLEILKQLYAEERWQNIFVEVFKIIYFHLEDKSYKEIIHFLTHSSEDFKEQSLHILKGISEVIAPSVKSYLTKENSTIYHSILKDLVKNKNIVFVEFMFKIIGKESFYIFLNEEGIKCFEELIKLKMFSYIEKVLKDDFFMDDIATLRKALEKLVLHICCYYAENDDLGTIETFLKWMFTDEKKIKDKINDLLYQGQGDLIQSFFSMDNISEKDIGRFDNFLLGCLGSEKEVNEYKRHIVIAVDISDDPHCVIINYNTIKDFVLSNKFIGLDLMLKWCLLNDDKISKLKKRLLYEYGNGLLNTIILKDNYSQLLNSFVSFCTCSPHEHEEFQRKILNATEFHVRLFESGQYYAAKDLINWCSDFCEEETQELKEKLFPLVIKQFVCHSTNNNEFEDFKEWINISWTTFMKCHFTVIGINLLYVNENFLRYHAHFLCKLWNFLTSRCRENERDDEASLLSEA